MVVITQILQAFVKTDSSREEGLPVFVNPKALGAFLSNPSTSMIDCGVGDSCDLDDDNDLVVDTSDFYPNDYARFLVATGCHQ